MLALRVYNSEILIDDLFSDSNARPRLDPFFAGNLDIILIEGSYSDGMWDVKFLRKRDTLDVNDFVVTVSDVAAPGVMALVMGENMDF